MFARGKNVEYGWLKAKNNCTNSRVEPISIGYLNTSKLIFKKRTFYRNFSWVFFKYRFFKNSIRTTFLYGDIDPLYWFLKVYKNKTGKLYFL